MGWRYRRILSRRRPRLTQPNWYAEAEKAVDVEMGQNERRLLMRLAEAKGQRVSISELATAFGLPSSTSPAQDFPQLTAFCAANGFAMPIEASGEDESGWYWLEMRSAKAFEVALRPWLETDEG